MSARMAWTACALLACRIEPAGVPEGGPFHDGDPAVVGLAFECDRARSQWALDVETDAWTGGGVLYITRDGSEVERHPFSSQRAAGDGAWDCLGLTLAQVASRLDARPGSSTRWLCRDTLSLSYLVVVTDPVDEQQTDCRAWGADPTLWAEVEGVPACADVVDASRAGVVEPGFSVCE